MRYIPALDGLRAIAVLAVVAYHAGLPAPAGFVGVDVFFVISGYLITGLLAREYRDTGRIDFAAFYARRVRRILPALLVVVASTLLLGSWLMTASDRLALARSAVAGLGMFANLHFRGLTGGYFDAAADSMPLLHLWTLSVEEQFYVLWPPLLVAALRWRARWLVAVVAAASLAWSQWLAASDPQGAFYLMPARLWELAAGGLLVLYPVKRTIPHAATAGVALILLACLVPLGALPAVAGAALVIHGAGEAPGLASKPMRFFGLISYGLYLWHWPLLALDKATRIGESPLLVRLGLCALAVLLAALSYRFVETPFRRALPKLSRPAVIVIGVFSLVMVMTGAAKVEAQAHAAQALATATGLDLPGRLDRCSVSAVDHRDALPPADCQSRPGKPAVVMWGDSHALAWKPFARAEWPDETIAYYTYTGCPPAIGYALPGKKYPDHPAHCAEFNRKALAAILRDKPRIVVLAARWTQLRGTVNEGVAESVAALRDVPQVYIFGPTPTLRANASHCIEANMLARCAEPRRQFDKAAEAPRAFLAELAKRPNVHVIDSTAFFCNERECPVMRDGYALYWDDNHISSTAARAFSAEW